MICLVWWFREQLSRVHAATSSATASGANSEAARKEGTLPPLNVSVLTQKTSSRASIPTPGGRELQRSISSRSQPTKLPLLHQYAFGVASTALRQGGGRPTPTQTDPASACECLPARSRRRRPLRLPLGPSNANATGHARACQPVHASCGEVSHTKADQSDQTSKTRRHPGSFALTRNKDSAILLKSLAKA